MRPSEWVLFAVVGWCGVGAIGVALSLRRGRLQEARRHVFWLAGAAAAYLVIVLAVAWVEPQRVLGLGQAECFGSLCFSVTGVDPVPGLIAADTSRVIRVRLRVDNRSPESAADTRVAAYLLDGQGRRWEPVRGLSGNRLTSRVASRAEIVCEPVFQIAPNSTGLRLVLTEGFWQPGTLTIGDSDSLGHRRTEMRLGQ